ncbi:hypothetical protein FOZ63_025535, partial [Perkinsus olseni]
CMVMVEVECAEASYKGRALLSEGPMEMDAATRRMLDNIIAAGGTRFQVQLIGDDGGEVDAMLQVMSNGVRLTVTAPRNSYEPMECCYSGEYPEVRIYPADHASRFDVIASVGVRWKLRALSRQARDLVVLTIRSLKGLQLYGNSRALVDGELGEGGGRLVILLEMERLRTKVAGLVGEAERLRRQCRKAVAEKQTLADQLTDTIEAYTQVMESGSSGISEAYRPAITGDVGVREEVETLRLSNRHLTAEVKTLRAEILKTKREFAAEKAAFQEALQSKNGCAEADIEETQVAQDAQVRKLDHQKSLLEEERDRLKEELQQLSEMYLELWSKGCPPDSGAVVELKQEVIRLKEENESLRSRVRKLLARSEAPPEPDDLPEVHVRLRPPYDPFGGPSNLPWHELYAIDDSAGSEVTLTVKDPLSNGRCEHYFQFGEVHSPEVTQSEIFERCGRPLVDRLLLGYSGCIFAYGQTGSGKSHSVFGPNLLKGETLRTGCSWEGILPRAVRYLFKKIVHVAKSKECALVASFVEIYLDQIRDLGLASSRSAGVDRQRPASAPTGRHHTRSSSSLVSNTRPNSATGFSFGSPARLDTDSGWESQNLEIHETPAGQVFVKDLTLLPIRNVEELLDIVRKGSALRATYETAINSVSSRSHTIFSLNLVTRDRAQNGKDVISGTLNFVDLAGSERLAKSRSEGARFQEAVIVNSSLSALSKVILALSIQSGGEGGGQQIYVGGWAGCGIVEQDSKLTRLLSPALGGNSFTTLLCTINPATSMYQESLNTLQFADRCKNVHNRPVVGYSSVGGVSQDWRVRGLLQEIAELKAQLALAKSSFEQRIEAMNGRGNTDRKSVKTDEDGEELAAEAGLMREAEALREQIAAEQQKARRAEEKAEKLRGDWQFSRDRQLAEEEAMRRQRLEFMEKCREREARAAMEVEEAKRQREKSEKEMADRIRGLEAFMREAFLGSQQNKLTEKLSTLVEQLRNISSSCRESIRSSLARAEEMRVRQLSEQKAAYEEALRSKEMQWRHCYRADKRSTISQLREELLRLYNVNRSLCRVVEDLEEGRYAVRFSSGVKRAVLPASVAKE